MAYIIDGLDARIKIDPFCSLQVTRLICPKETYAPTFLTRFVIRRLITAAELSELERSEVKCTVLRRLTKGHWAALAEFPIGNLSDNMVAAMSGTAKVFQSRTKDMLGKMVERLKSERK